jgi:hypothetical protein
MNKFRAVLIASALIPFNAIADQLWQVTFNETKPREAVELLGNMFQMTPVNLGARCLENPITFSTESAWQVSEAKELISQVVQLAGCEAVIYEGNKFVVQDSILGA